MQSQNIPDCISKALYKLAKEGHWTDASYHLGGAGRAIAFVRMAADTLESLDNELRVAEYHAYAGISAARTAIDATASWLRLELELPVLYPAQVDLKRKDFRKKVVGKQPTVESFVRCLGELADVIDEHRQRAQHREGLALIFHSPCTKVLHSGGWYLASKGLSHPRTDDVRLANLLRKWAGMIEQNLCSIVEQV